MRPDKPRLFLKTGPVRFVARTGCDLELDRQSREQSDRGPGDRRHPLGRGYGRPRAVLGRDQGGELRIVDPFQAQDRRGTIVRGNPTREAATQKPFGGRDLDEILKSGFKTFRH